MTNPGGRIPRSVTPPETLIIDLVNRVKILERIVIAGGLGTGTGGGVVPELGANGMGAVLHDGDEWPPRPDAIAVIWIGPVAPTIGGTGAADGIDIWIPTVTT